MYSIMNIPIEDLMNPQELLKYTEQSASTLLKTKNRSISFKHLNGYTLDDVVQDSLLKILGANVKPRTKSYVSEVVFTTIADLNRSNKVPLEPEVVDLRLDTLLDADTTLGHLKAYLDPEDSDLFTKYYETNRTIDQVAEDLSVSSRTVKRRLNEVNQSVHEFLM